MPIDLGDYTPVSDRIALFRSRYPNGSLQPVSLDRPYWIENIGEQTFIVYAAAAYRTAGDAQPGIGLAWEPFPGKTNYTRDSELQNAETSAWGRAIVAVLAADVRGGVATRDDVERRNRDAEHVSQSPPPEGFASWPECGHAHDEVSKLIKALPDEIDREPFQAFRAEHGWPMPAERLAELVRFAEEAAVGYAARQADDPTRPFDEPTVQEPTSPEDTPSSPVPKQEPEPDARLAVALYPPPPHEQEPGSLCRHEWETEGECLDVRNGDAHECEWAFLHGGPDHKCSCGEVIVGVEV